MKKVILKGVQLTRGNHKLPRSTAIWDLPHMVTCPGATEECKKYCYANKAERLYKAVLPYRQRNFVESKKGSFVAQMLSQLAKARTIKAVRIHSSGDFYNQEYLNKWVEIMKARPDIIFTAYTKSLHLDFTQAKKCKNFVLFASVDPTTPKWMLKLNKIRRKAVVIDRHAKKAPRGYFLCPGSCKTCSHCYTPGTTSVAFRQH